MYRGNQRVAPSACTHSRSRTANRRSAPSFATINFTHLRLTLGSGTAVPCAVAERRQQVTGCTLVEANGLTETSPAACMNPMDLPAYTSLIGYSVLLTHACVKDDDG